MKLVDVKTNEILLEDLKIADKPMARFKGLLFSKKLVAKQGLWLTPCNAIHMFGMRYPIDALFLDKDNRVVEKLENLLPNTVSPLVWKAHSVVEMPSGSLKLSSLKIQDQVKINE